MALSIFEYDDYLEYLEAYAASLPKRGYGFRSQIARELNCQTAYVTQVFKRQAHFSLDQAEIINRICRHDAMSADYFLLMVLLARAQTEELRRRWRKQMDQLRAQQSHLSLRFQARNELSPEDTAIFYSHWSYAAIYLGVLISYYKDKKRLQRSLGLSDDSFERAFRFLVDKGLLVETPQLKPGATTIFIGKDESILRAHHANWRLKAVQSLDQELPSDLHFTSLFSMSRKDSQKIREILVSELKKIRETVKNSADEELHLLGVDFFRVDRTS